MTRESAAQSSELAKLRLAGRLLAAQYFNAIDKRPKRDGGFALVGGSKSVASVSVCLLVCSRLGESKELNSLCGHIRQVVAIPSACDDEDERHAVARLTSCPSSEGARILYHQLGAAQLLVGLPQ